nr:coiled coil domain containing protein 39 [Hymenolepis microstoma]
MEADLIKEALLETGWRSSFAFPIASKENMKFLEVLAETKAKIAETNDSLEMYEEKNSKLKDHLALIFNERKLTEQLKFEVDREISDLEQFIKLTEQENRRTVNDHKRLVDQKKKIASRLESLGNEVFLKSNELQNIKSELDCDQKLVEQFITDCESEHALMRRLETLNRAENFIIKRLTNEEKKLGDKRTELLKKLDTMVCKNEVIQLQIDAMADMSREENRGRQEMLQLWGKTIKQISDRDEDFTKLEQDYDGLLSDINERLGRLHELEKLLGSVGQDNAEAKVKANELNKRVGDLRHQAREEKADSATSENELEALKRHATRVSGDLLQQRTSNSLTKKTNAKLSTDLLTTENAVEMTKQKLEHLKTENISAEETLRLVEEELDAEIQCQDLIRKKIAALKNKRYALIEERNKAEGDKKTIEVQMTGSRQKMQYVERQIANDELELTRMEKFIYNAMYKANSLDSRILRMESNKTFDSDGIALENHVRHLQEQYDDQCQSSKSLANMIEQFFSEKRLLYLQTEKLKELIQKESFQMDNINLYITTASRSLDAAIRDRNDLLVFFNLCRYQLRRAEEQCRLWKECTLSAEVRSKAIAALTRELEEESSARVFKVEAEMRTIGQDISRIKTDLARRQRRVEQLMSRYDIETSKISGDEEVGFEQAHINLIVKSLVEHTELQAKGDELDQEVKKAEEELKALENTLLVMTTLNDNARSYTASQDPELTKNKQDLVEKFNISSERLRAARENRRMLRADILRFEVELDALEENISKMEKIAVSHEMDIAKLRKTNEELDCKLKRALRAQTLAKTKALQTNSSVESDIEIKLLKDFNESVNNLLAFSIKSSPNINEDSLIIAQELCKKYGLKTPTPVSSVDNSTQNRQSTDSGASIAKVVDFNASDMLGTTNEKKALSRKPGREGSNTKKNISRPSSTTSSATISIRSINDFFY